MSLAIELYKNKNHRAVFEYYKQDFFTTINDYELARKIIKYSGGLFFALDTFYSKNPSLGKGRSIRDALVQGDRRSVEDLLGWDEYGIYS